MGGTRIRIWTVRACAGITLIAAAGAREAAPRKSAAPAQSSRGFGILNGALQANPNPLFAGEAVEIVVTVNPGADPASTGITVVANLSAIGGNAGQTLTETTPGANVFTHQLVTACGLNADIVNLEFEISAIIRDAQGRSSDARAALMVRPNATQIGETLPPGAPQNDGQPDDALVCAGETARFSVFAEGPNLTYQWHGPNGPLVDGGRISGVTAAMLQIGDAQPGDAGPYHVVVAGACTGSVQSNPAVLSLTAGPTADDRQVVISQVYGGGGNHGSTYTHDFIELFNKGAVPVNLAGWSVQYASSDLTGTSPEFNNPSRITLLDGVIQPGKFHLIQESSGGDGTIFLPTPDLDGTLQVQGPILIGAQGGKIALVRGTAPLAGPCPLDSCTVVDFIGWNSGSTCYEGGGPGPSTNNTTAVVRVSPCMDTDDNAADFTGGPPNPRNSAAPSAPGIVTQPADQFVCAGETALFGVVAEGACISYQWQVFNGSWINVTGGGQTLTFATGPVTTGDHGRQYRVIVSGPYGPPATSAAASTLIAPANAGDRQVVISQVYPGGGNSGALYTHDYIELYNRGAFPVDVTGWSVQYASAGGNLWRKTDLDGVIAPGNYFLIQQGRGSGGTVALPDPDIIGGINMSVSAGKVVLLKGSHFLDGFSCPADCRIVDRVGYGTQANCFEGAAPAPRPVSNAHAVVRDSACVDTDQNADDFVSAMAEPNAVPADFNKDGFVDWADAGLFEACVTGPALGPAAEGCADKDLDRDGDVDQSDYGLFQACFSGPYPVDPACAGCR